MSPQRTPLYERHVALGGRLVSFAGWELPVQYAGIVAEHLACRRAAALFDVSHMGELTVAGPGAVGFLEHVLTGAFADLEVGRCRYSLLCSPDGGILDDLIVYRLADEEFFLIVNAANTTDDLAWLRSHLPTGVDLTDISATTALLALQGPAAPGILARLIPDNQRLELGRLRYYRFATYTVAGVSTIVSRTGYTGGPGYELACAADDAVGLWDALLAEGEADGLAPAGLGARDTLRLEAGFCLHGHDIGPGRNPIEAGLGRFVELGKPEFIGREALQQVRASGTREKLTGLRATDRGVIRDGCPVVAGGEPVGSVTSGSFSPCLNRSIALAYVRRDLASQGTVLAVEVRGRELGCEVVEPPFYRG